MQTRLFGTVGAMLMALCVPQFIAIPDAKASFASKMSNGMVCRANFGGGLHYHGANGANANKQMAQQKAIRDWSKFTAFEYGRRWGTWSIAIDQSMTCEHDKAAGVWRCRADGVPCRN